MKEARPKTFYITFMSVISMCAVVFLHTNGVFWLFSPQRYWYTANIIESLFYFAVPIFFMISGATLLDYQEHYSTKEFFIRRAKKTVIPFFAWSLIGAVYRYIFGGGFPGPLPLANDILSTSIISIYWFFPSLFCVYLTIPLFAGVAKEKKRSTFTYLAVGGFFINALIPLLIKVFSIDLVWPFSVNSVSDIYIYICIGYLLSHYPVSRKWATAIYGLSVVGLVAHILGTGFLSVQAGAIDMTFEGYGNATCIMYTSGIFLFARNHCKGTSPLASLIATMGNYTFGVYLCHIYVMWLFQGYVCKPLGLAETSILYRLGAPFVIIPICILIIYLLRKIPVVRAIVPGDGEKSPTEKKLPMKEKAERVWLIGGFEMKGSETNSWIRENKAYIQIFMVVFAVGILAHLSLFASQVTNPDGVMDGLFKFGHNWEFALGRWGIALVDALRRNIVLPALTSIFTIFILSLTAFVLTRVLGIRSKLFCLLSGILLVVFPTFAQMLTYYYCSDSYSLSLLIAALAVLLVLRWDSWKAVLPAAVMLMFSLSIYQSFIGVAIACSYLIILLQLLDAKMTLKQVAARAGRLLVSGGGGLVLYFISFRICSAVTGIPPADYRGISSLGSITLSMLPGLTQDAYQGFWSFFFAEKGIYNNQWWGLRPVYGGLLALLLVLLIIRTVQLWRAEKLSSKDRTVRAVLAGVLVILAPLAFYTIVFLTPQTTVAYLMVPQMVLIFFFIFALLTGPDHWSRRGITVLAVVLTMLLQMKWIVLSNSIYTAMQAEEKQIYSQSIRLLDRIESYPDYVPGEQVTLVGYFSAPEYPIIYPPLWTATEGTTGTTGQLWWWDADGAAGSWYWYFARYHGTAIHLSDPATVSAVKATEEFQRMPSFPSKDSIGRINGILVVKCSE